MLDAVDLHVHTVIFPRFEQARDWTALVADLAFGVAAAVDYRAAAPRPDA